MTSNRTWPSATIGEIADVRLGKMLSSKVRETGLVQVPYLRNENIRWGTIRFDDVKVLGLRQDEIARYSVEPGDLLVCEGGEPGRCAVYRGPPGVYAYQKALHRVRPKEGKIRVELLQYWLEHLAKTGALASKIAQTTIQHLPLERIVQIEVPVPPMAQQDFLIDALDLHLSRIDAGVVALKRGEKALKSYRAAVLKAACEGRLAPTEAELARRERRPYAPAEELLPRILDERRARWERDQIAKMKAKGALPRDDKWKGKYRAPPQPMPGSLPALPEGWRWSTVETVGDVLLGRQRAPQYLTGKWSRPYLRVANVKDDALDLSDVEEMDFDPAHFEKYRLEPGDILVSEGQSPELVGQSAIYDGQIAGLCFQKTLHRFRSVPGGPSAKFAQIVFRSHVKNGVFQRMASITTNIAHLTLEKFVAAPFPLPPAAEQERIVREVDRLMSFADDVERSIKTNLARARELRRAVLREAFNGGLVPPSARRRTARPKQLELQPLG